MLWPLFGGREVYERTPLWKTMRHRLRLIGEKNVERRRNQEQEERLADQQREWERQAQRR